MSLDTPIPSPELSYASRHILSEPTLPLPFTPRSNVIPGPWQPIDSPSHTDTDTAPELCRPHNYTSKHRAESPRLRERFGGRAAKIAAVIMFGTGISMYGVGSSIEASMEQEITSATALEDLTPAIERNASDTASRDGAHAAPSTRPTQGPTTKAKAPAQPVKHAPPTTAQQKPAPGTDCNYMPKHQHKASETSSAQAMAIGKEMIIACFGTKQWPATKDLLRRESNWRPMATNPKSKSCGIPQAWPCIKLLRAAKANSLGNTTVEKQIHWFIEYVMERYGTPEKARRHWLARVPVKGRDMGHWY